MKSKKFVHLLILILTLLITSKLAQKALQLRSQAQISSASLEISPNQASLPPNTDLSVRVQTSAAIGFVNLEITFDPSKIRLRDESTHLITNPVFSRIVKLTPKSQANSTGVIEIVLGINPPSLSTTPAPTGLIEIIKLPLTSVSTISNDAVSLNFTASKSFLVDTSANVVTITSQTSSTLALNTISTTPSPTTSVYTCTGPTVTLSGTTDRYYRISNTANGTTYDARNWINNAVGTNSSTAMKVGLNGPLDLCIIGGVIHGHIDPAWSWDQAHSYGGAGIESHTSRYDTLSNARIHNVEDGWKPREYPEFGNTGIMQFKGVYMTGIRDDAIENDNFMPGFIADSLFDGVHAFLSEQNQSGYTPQTIGPAEDQYIRLTNVYARLHTNNSSGTALPGHFFKWQPRGTTSHKLIITDSVLATNAVSRNGWSAYNFPAGTQFIGTNYLLWLGPPGTYGAARPSGVIFLEGQAAKDKWNEVRNTWLISHGYSPRPADDWYSVDDPVFASQ